MERDPVAIAVAAERLQVPEGRIRVWGTRYRARKAKVNGVVYWDYNDLSTIEAFVYRGEPVPKTPELRDAHRVQLQNAA
ncbi:hypothetical protein [Nonomuraea sp. NPDC049400]|uniref:hypothetical protein n=1 Tax=Nonomuraea sp. NPDC049400 TaxID=3364352 RepID=UPI00379658FF